MQLTQQQKEILGVDSLTPAKQEKLLERIGQTVFDTALVELLETLNDEQIYALNYALETCDSYEAVMERLRMMYPSFLRFLDDAQKKFVELCIQNMQQTV